MANIVIFGDICIDRYHFGDVKKISPEAPIPILKCTYSEERLGMSGNVALNLISLGNEPYLFTSTGDKTYRILKEKRIPSVILNSKDIIKNRYIANKHPLLRMDEELNISLTKEDEKYFNVMNTQNEVTIVQDYGKGAVTKKIIENAVKHTKYLLIDPCGYESLSKYNVSPFCIFPNKQEAENLTKKKMKNVDDTLNVCDIIQRRTGSKHVLLKLSEDGMIFYTNRKNFIKLNALTNNVVDVTGAGDTVIATFASCLHKNINIYDAAHIANVAASIVVQKMGTSVATWDEINANIQRSIVI